MSKNRLQSHIDVPERRTTARGGSYITPFDLIRSRQGREAVDAHVRMSENEKTKKPEEVVKLSPSPQKKG